MLDLASWSEFMPDSDEIHLPYLFKKEIMQLYINYCNSNNKQELICSKSYFYETLKNDEIYHIKIRKCIRFAKCSKCVIIKEKLTTIIDINERKKLET